MLLALVVGGCGGEDGGGSGDIDPLSYLPADAGLVVVVDTDLDGPPVRALEQALARPLEGKRFEQSSG